MTPPTTRSTWKSSTFFFISTRYLPILSTLFIFSSAVFAQSDLPNLDSESPPLSSGSNLFSTAKKRYWLAEKLVHGHLALSQSWLDKPAFSAAPNILTSVGAPDYITRHVKGGEEGPWWNTTVGTRHCSRRDPLCLREPAKEILASSQIGEKRIIAYYRHVWEKSFADPDLSRLPNPQVLCLDEKGAPQFFDGTNKDGKGSYFLSLSSSHKDVVKQRFVELAQMGYEAVYLDFKHQPEKGCWDQATRSAYKLATGREVPEPRSDTTFNAELSNPLFRSYLAFNNRQIATAFKEWQEAAQQVNRNFTLVISASYMNSLTTPHLSTNMFPVGSMAKTEFRLPIAPGPSNGGSFYRAPADMPVIEESSRMAFGYSMLRSATFNTPPHVWLHVARLNQEATTLTKKEYFPPTREELTGGAAAVLGLGGIANIHIDNEMIESPSLQAEYAASFTAARRWMDKIGDNTAAMSQVGVHFSERLRWRQADTQESFWIRGNLPAVASFDVLTTMGVPAEVVVDRALNRELPSYMKALIIVNPIDSLTPLQKSRIEDFVARGGELIDASALSWRSSEYQSSRSWLTGRLKKVPEKSFIQVEFPAATKQRTFTVLTGRTESESGKKVLLIPNDFSWITRLGPDEVNPAPVVSGVVLRFPNTTKAPVVESLNGALPKRLPVNRNPLNGGYTVQLPAFGGPLGIYSIE